MAEQKLREIFEKAKRILCAYDYEIQIPKKKFHITNTENMLPHLMGMQYVGRPGMYTGDRGVYFIKKGKLKYHSIEKLIRKYYQGEKKQNSMLAMVYGKIDHIQKIEEMLSSYSKLYLYDVAVNSESELKTDYLLVNEQESGIFQLGFLKTKIQKCQVYHCNSFLVSYRKNDNYDLYYRNLKQCDEISKIIREDKKTKRRQVIYQSKNAELREYAGIQKMLEINGIRAEEELVTAILALNQQFGEFCAIDLLTDIGELEKKCYDKKDRLSIKKFESLWENRKLTGGYKT